MIEARPKTRSNNRREKISDAAAALFVEKGFSSTSIRDIAKAAGMLPGSLYYHFSSKEDLLTAVFEEGVKRISESVDAALAATGRDPWERLQSASEAHLSILLDGSNYAQVVVRILPADVPGAEKTLVLLRDEYESRFISLFNDLPIASGTDRSVLRLMLIGAMNHVPVWFRKGRDTPAGLARKFINTLRRAQTDAKTKPTYDIPSGVKA